MSRVQFGRRKGALSADQLDRELSDAASRAKPSKTDLRKVKVLTKDDWDRIQYSLNKDKIERDRTMAARAEKEAMKKQSYELWKDWTNTLAGARQKKLEARKLREAKEEEERKQIDIEEAKIQAAKRKEAIERAKVQQYYDTDRVRTFHSALRLVETLKERDAQIELNRLRARANDAEKQQLEDWHRELDEKRRREQETRKQMLKSAAEHQKELVQQMREREEVAKREAVEEKKEGELIEHLARQHEIESKRLSQIREIEKRKIAEAMRNQIDDQRKLSELNRLHDEQADEECRLFASAKRKMMKLRAAKETDLHKAKMERLDNIRAKLTKTQQAMQDNEDERIRRAVEEMESRHAVDEKHRNDRVKLIQKQIVEHRKQQIALNSQTLKEQKDDDVKTLELGKQIDAMYFKAEEARRGKGKETLLKLEDFRRDQTLRKAKEMETERIEDVGLMQRNLEIQALEEVQFQEYAGRVINHLDKTGRNTIPLRKAARAGIGGGEGPLFKEKNLRPAYKAQDVNNTELPHFHNEVTEETKKAIGVNAKTNKRLGFNYD